MADRKHFTIDKGATFRRVLHYTDPATGDAIDLTGYTGRWQARAEDGTLMVDEECAVVDDTIEMYLTAEQTSALTGGPYKFAVEAAAGSGEPVLRIVEGTLALSEEIVLT